MRILVATLCLSLLIATAATAKIVFAATHAADANAVSIYVMEDDGTGVTPPLTTATYLAAPRWSPDGKQIVFSRQVHPKDWSRYNIVVMNADGTNVRTLTNPQNGLDAHPSFSPDGTAVLFKRFEQVDDKLQNCVCMIDLESGKIKELSELGVNFPAISPDGKHIVFSPIPILGKTGSNLRIMGADGHNPRELLPPLPKGELLIDRTYARWSPNGKQILYYQYESTYDAAKGFIPHAHRYFIYYFTTGQLRPLRIPKTYRSAGLDWMDNGKSIVFSAVEVKLKEPVDGVLHPYHLYKYQIATGEITRLTAQPWVNPSLDWISDDVLPVSPKGKHPTQWGKLKTFLPPERDVEAFPQNVRSFLSE